MGNDDRVAPLVQADHMRPEILQQVADRVPAGETTRVGVDGPDGSGKTFLADELAEVLRGRGRPAVRVSVDDFHQVRAVRYRRGRDSPEGYWLDSFDYGRLRSDVLLPFAPGGSRRYRSAAHDLVSDAPLAPPWQTAPPGAVLIVDGVFLHREELADSWDMSVFLEVPFAVTARRMAVRDGSSPDPDHPSMRRYVEGQRIYFATCRPQLRATVVLDNSDLAAPRIRRG